MRISNGKTKGRYIFDGLGLSFSRIALPVAVMVCFAALGSAQEITLRMSFWGDEEGLAAFQETVDEFEAVYPNIHIQLERPEPYLDAVTVMIATGTAPDLMMIAPQWFHALAKGGAFLPLDSLIASDPDFGRELFIPQIWDLYQWDGVQYGVPPEWQIMSFWYNKDLFNERGLAAPDETWTWDTVREAARQLTVRQGDGEALQWGYGQSHWWGSWLLQVWSAGGDLFSDDGGSVALDSPEAMQAFQFYYDLMWQDETMPTPAEQSQAGGFGNAFMNGRLGMLLDGRWATRTFAASMKDRIAYDIAPMPRFGEQVNILHSNALTISRDTQHPEEAYRFFTFFNTNERAQIAQGRGGLVMPSYIPVLRDQNLWYNPSVHVSEWINVDAIAYSKVAPFRLGFEPIVGAFQQGLNKGINARELDLAIAAQEGVRAANVKMAEFE